MPSVSGEFDLIRTYFAASGSSAACKNQGVQLGVGDDAALLAPTPGHQLAITTDSMVSGVHFLPDDPPAPLGHKLLAVNLSDLAAMGARPRWVTLNLCLPYVDVDWLDAFARGLHALAAEHQVCLVGGDTVRGPLNLALTALGEVPSGQALRRDGACVGDWIVVSGTPGEAALGLAHRLGKLSLAAESAQHALARLQRPTPRVGLGLALRGLATSAIDVSDGLAQDLGHILEASGVGAVIEHARLPRSQMFVGLPHDRVLQAQLAGGDDYELLFTVPAGSDLRHLPCPVSVIGQIQAQPGLRIVQPDGAPYVLQRSGYDHFHT